MQRDGQKAFQSTHRHHLPTMDVTLTAPMVLLKKCGIFSELILLFITGVVVYYYSVCICD